jgi:fatty acid desaturase
MTAATSALPRASFDQPVFAAALLHGACVTTALVVATDVGAVGRVAIAIAIGLAMNWGANTVSHIHLHRPLFRGAAANRLFSAYLSVLLAVPQRWWKLLHLRHHHLVEPGRPMRLGVEGVVEIALVLAALALLAALAPALLAVVLPALAVGFGLCALQGHAEHARAGAGVDYHGRIYNRLWFNDGFHAAHHRAPSADWRRLADDGRADDTISRLPPALRWLEALPGLANRAVAASLDWLERVTQDIPIVRRHLLRAHAAAFASLLSSVERQRIRAVTVIGGALFPRTALALGPLLPQARFTIIDRAAAHVASARKQIALAGLAERVAFEIGSFDAIHPPQPCDLLVLPLAFRGERARYYRRPPAPLVAIHDWAWRSPASVRSARVLLLPKRINLVTGPAA